MKVPVCCLGGLGVMWKGGQLLFQNDLLLCLLHSLRLDWTSSFNQPDTIFDTRSTVALLVVQGGAGLYDASGRERGARRARYLPFDVMMMGRLVVDTAHQEIDHKREPRG